MKHLEFYNKYKTTYPAISNPGFSKRNRWYAVLIIIIAVMFEPLLFMSKFSRSSPFSFIYYLQLVAYLSLVAFPFVGIFIWINQREAVKRSRGYGWVGKFEVTKKRSLFVSHYLSLTPGNGNKIRVAKNLFDKIRIGDFILVHRDALGNIEEVNKTKNFSSRLTRRMPQPN